MPAQGVSMHKIREILRLHFDSKLNPESSNPGSTTAFPGITANWSWTIGEKKQVFKSANKQAMV